MQKLLVIVLALLSIGFTANAQKTKKPVKRTTAKKAAVKKVKKELTTVMEMMVVGEDGQTTFEPVYKGDKLVYAINAGGNTYDFIITLNEHSYEKGIDFNYEMTNENKTSGHVFIPKASRNDAKKYVNYFRGGDVTLVGATTVWMSNANFMDMPDKKTKMTFDDGEEETFYRPEKDEARPEIIFKGKKAKLDGFKINNAEDEKGNKTLIIHNISANPLILKMDIGFTVELKEIR